MKKKVLGLAGVALAAVLIAGGTYAYFQSTTTDKTNNFVMGAGVSAEVAEPRWDGVCFTGNDCIDANGNNLTTDPLFNQGKEMAKDFAPGNAIAKDPIIKNTSDSRDIYVAVKISYGNGIANYTELNKFAEIDFNTTNWEFNADKTVAYYKTAVVKGAKTQPVFTTVKIKEGATAPSGQTVKDTDMKNFDITIKGFVTQTTDIDGATTAKEALDIVFGSQLTN